MPRAAYTIGVVLMALALVVFAYFDLVYRELGRVATGRVREHLDAFEAEVEPRLRIERRRAARVFALLARLWLVLTATLTARGVLFFVPGTWEAAVETIFFLGCEVVIGMQLLPPMMLAGFPGGWAVPLVPFVRVFAWVVRPVQAALETSVSVLRLSEDEPVVPANEQEKIGALVDAATEEGIIEQDEARLIEQVVEFGEKRAGQVMTPRPDVVAIPASASLEQLRDIVVETKYSRLPVYGESLDDVLGIVMARDILQVPESEAAQRRVRELIRPAIFVPESKFGSELLKEMQRENQQMAIVIDEYGQTAGVVTMEDLVEEIVGEIGEEDRRPAPDVVREPGGAMVLRGSAPLERVADLFGMEFDADSREEGALTVAGLLNAAAGHVPRAGEVIETEGLRFEVLEANQRKVLRVRARRGMAGAASPARGA